MHALLDSDYLSITFRPDLDMLVARWLREVSGSETREGYHQILAAARQTSCPFWLLDGRRRTPADAETTQWGFQEFFPTLSSQLGQNVFLSQLLSPFYQQITQALPVFQENEASTTHTYTMRRFNDEASAVAWLRECQQGPGR
ncbi:hypothetical protein [Hymenobacter canadensis]|uniref:STAS/SEC14 domain-containing protein n=1 Tax=Hymenobacter canadensis TaxID=2999067 RepID=A0ABY7LSU9_9BACT|nr:hypothetical protein [Hymenobacter canadensis]WBA42929.1 hypothetical protein O3303_05040 [Hymenobacter canadensis]